MTLSNLTKINETHETSKRTPATKITDLPGLLPNAQVLEDVDILAVVESKLRVLSSLAREDLTDNAVWRDSFALTGTFRTFYTGDSVFEAWETTTTQYNPVNFVSVPDTAHIVRVGAEHSWVDARFTFETTTSQLKLSCSGYLSLIPDGDGQWRIWMLRTILEQLGGYGNVDALNPILESHVDESPNNSVVYDAPSTHNELRHFDCIVVGGGQAGLGVGSRLQALNVSYLIIDRHPIVGDSWNSRYDSVKLHTAREYGHLPFWRTYDSSYPEFLTKELIAAGHREHVRRFGINIWTSTEMQSSSWSEDQRIWTCRLNRAGEELTMTTHHLVFAMGAASHSPLVPEFTDREKFNGIIMHSADYKSASDWKGKRGLVIGSANTAHDIADDMLRAGLKSVTMVQRGRTWVLPVEHYMAMTIPSYNDKVPIDLADRSSFSFPLSIQRQITMFYLHSMAQKESKRYDALERAGFNVERYGDIVQTIYERGGGHYMDVGTSAKISQGLIKVKSNATATHYVPDGLAFSDGTELQADVIVFATGFIGNMRQLAGTIVGPQIENQLEDFWELDSEGEIRGAFKNTGHPGVWYVGGAIGVARYYSRFVALQIKLALIGVTLPAYTEPPARRLATTNEVTKETIV
ncbi:dimethylaniline monooxygenase (N-oxide forming) [Xylogone sp. PMI_703]|nr:dimethylaniline monooxygenase (N-oxide forming) [Xylogone sp. PMI_703]